MAYYISLSLSTDILLAGKRIHEREKMRRSDSIKRGKRKKGTHTHTVLINDEDPSKNFDQKKI